MREENNLLITLSLTGHICLITESIRDNERQKGRGTERKHTARYSKPLASVLISKEHELGVAYFLLFSAPKFHATIPTP